MKVFISWSGIKSKAVGELLDEWLQCVLQAIDPWMSSKDIDRGSLWFSEITDQLKDTSIGIICLTNANKEKPWILFEAGALAKGLTANRVCTLLIDLKPEDVSNPLAQFNHTFPDKEGIWELVKTLNMALDNNKLKENVLERVFDTYWPQFEESFKEILDISEEVPKIKREPNDILYEILSTTRALDRRIRNVENKKVADQTNYYYDKKPKISKKQADILVKNMLKNQKSIDEIQSALSENNVPGNYIKGTIGNILLSRSDDVATDIDDDQLL